MKTTLRRVLIILAVLLASDHFVVTQHVSIPQSLKFCSRSSPKIANCIRDSVEHLKPFLKSGNLGNDFIIGSLEPLLVDDIKLERGRGFFFNMVNIKAYRVSNFKVDKVRVNMNNLEFELLIDLPHIVAVGEYTINLLLGIVNIKGAGKLEADVENVRFLLKLKGTRFTQGGVEYIKFTSVDSKVQMPKIHFKLHNLFKDKTLNDVSNNLVNQNTDLFIDDIESKVQSSMTKSAFQSANIIALKIPFDVLFPQ